MHAAAILVKHLWPRTISISVLFFIGLPNFTQIEPSSGHVDIRCNTAIVVARICCEEGQRWKLCHGTLMVDFRAGCSSCSMTYSFVTNAVLIERAVSCWHLHQLISQTTQYLDSWLSDLLQSEQQMKLLEVEEGERAPVPHRWRRNWIRSMEVKFWPWP